MEFGEKLASRMTELGFNQTSLARACGLKQHTISQLVNGTRGKELPYRTVRLLKKALKVDDDFFSSAVSRSRRRTKTSSVEN